MGNTEVQNKSLKALLARRRSEFSATADEGTKRAYADGIVAVKTSDIIDRAKGLGDQAPKFKLKNAIGALITLDEYLKKGPVILTWYRGGWCPYCNITLQYLQNSLSEYKALGASLIALTPEVPDRSLSTKEKYALEFEVLSDVGNRIAKQYGIVFKLTPEVAKKYEIAFDLNTYNGDKSNELPLAATYIINKKGRIIYTFLDTDYRHRAEPADILKVLRNNRE